MKGKILWIISKIPKPDNHRCVKFFLNKAEVLWIDESNNRPFAEFDNRGDARKALNKKLSYEITNWGLAHVGRWIYKVEQIWQ